jgi:hypothetical protein
MTNLHDHLARARVDHRQLVDLVLVDRPPL